MRTYGLERWGLTLVSTLILAIGIGRVAWGVMFQERIEFSDGSGWDGVHYERLFNYFGGGAIGHSTAAFPYCARLAIPWILSLISNHVSSFYFCNIAVSILLSILSCRFACEIFGVDLRVVASTMFLSSFCYFSPLRFSSFYPIYVDPPFMLLMLLSMYFVVMARFTCAILVCIVAIPVKEAAFYVIPIVILYDVMVKAPSRKKSGLYCVLICGAVGIKVIVPYMLGCSGEVQLVTGAYWLLRALSDPEHFLSAVASVSLTAGPLWLISGSASLCSGRDHVLAFSRLAIVWAVVLAVCGGSDVARIFYGFSPLYAPLIIRALRYAGKIEYLCACVGWVLTNRVLQSYWQPGYRNEGGYLTGFFSQFPDYAGPSVALQTIGVWLVLGCICRGAARLRASMDMSSAAHEGVLTDSSGWMPRGSAKAAKEGGV
ncbi:nodulation protein noeP [Azorhizobium caulinodans ORS 571]|uniref:Nodulation protein noeP n=1 Tax=Azorhizobium caulinodans (strain ATCC 43989 / DSM 5975 / JCM 20966 / LMG 6465 / NBRC 14845 / NCIMB 13405 / ORS 571) TaxID=438753 RepID=A8INY4_AZOC5|nr:nodulation protein noeP [Azorhizobium caulinodans ORS 571]